MQPTDSQPSDDADSWSSESWLSDSWASDGWSSEDWWNDDSLTDEGLDDAWASDWSWNDWLADDGDATEPPADPAPQDEAARDAAPADAAPADTLTAESLSLDATALATDVLAAPTLTVSSLTLQWTPTAGVGSYVFVRKVSGQSDQYSLVSGTSVTPAAVPGATVRYSVRTNVSGSSWAPEVTISYPQASPDPTPTPTPTVDPTTAPTMSVSGTTVKWTSVGSVTSYVFVRKVPGQTPQYSLVTGTSVTPPAVAGVTVSYGVRTNVSGSTWADEVSIAYPSTPTPTPTPSPSPIDGTFQMGAVAGSALSYELSFLKALGAHTARMAFGVGTSASSMASTIDAYAKAGIRPLPMALFIGRVPSQSESQNLGSWAAAYGPGGTFWQGKTYPPNTAVTHIEFGNETSYSYQFADNSSGTYAARAQTYAQRARDAANAIRTANSRVGLLVQGDNAVNGTAWVTNELKAVPNLGDLIAGWTIHPYGPSWASRIDSTINSAKSAGARDLPIWITEWGLSSDNGRCLSDNYGWNKCMTYSSAASTLHTALTGMQSRYGSRLGAFFLYQAHDQYASGTQSGREAYFGALQSNGATKGAFTSEVKADLAAH